MPTGTKRPLRASAAPAVPRPRAVNLHDPRPAGPVRHEPASALAHPLQRLEAHGEVVRTSRGVYSAIDQSSQLSMAHRYVLALAPFREAAIAGWNALEQWSLTTQIPHTIT